MSPAVFDGAELTDKHEHYDRDGNLTGTTVVQRDSGWTDAARADALALLAWEASRCPSCGQVDTLIELPGETRNVMWEQHDSRVVQVYQYRCIACGAQDLMKRDFAKAHDKDEARPGQFIASDGRVFVAPEIDREMS